MPLGGLDVSPKKKWLQKFEGFVTLVNTQADHYFQPFPSSPDNYTSVLAKDISNAKYNKKNNMFII